MHSTSGSLLARLRQPSDEAAWVRFVKLYTPLLYHWAQRSGLAEQGPPPGPEVTLNVDGATAAGLPVDHGVIAVSVA